MHVGVRASHRQYADDITRVRDEVYEALKKKGQLWADNKPSFEDALEVEFAAFGTTMKESFVLMFQKMLTPEPGSRALLEMPTTQVSLDFMGLQTVLAKRGVPEAAHIKKIMEFLDWDRNREIPHNRISSYLFAAVAPRVAIGAKKIIDQGHMNDINMISTYAPYMDAMFSDKKSAELLREEPLASKLEYKSRIFSLSDTDEFISHLKEIETSTTGEIREFAARIYGVE